MSEYTLPALFRGYVARLQSSPRALTTISRTSEAMFYAGVREAIRVQRKWDDLTLSEAVAELRLGAESVFFPFFEDDPRVEATCDECGRVHVGAEGTCSECGREVPL